MGQLMTESKTIRILLADDHRIMRDGLKFLIKNQPNMDVVGEACHGKEAIEKTLDIAPDIVIMDVNMPNLDGIEATKTINQKNPSIKIVALSAHLEKNIIEQILKAGASAYIHKESAFSEFIRAINSIHDDNETYLCMRTRSVLINNYVSKLRDGSDGEPSGLTGKEYEVVRLLALGKTAKEIAFEMDISSKTVDAYRREIMAKLKVDNLAGLIKFAIREGIIVL
jgi:DNA-binding NarL/FixJ family response regulator